MTPIIRQNPAHDHPPLQSLTSDGKVSPGNSQVLGWSRRASSYPWHHPRVRHTESEVQKKIKREYWKASAHLWYYPDVRHCRIIREATSQNIISPLTKWFGDLSLCVIEVNNEISSCETILLWLKWKINTFCVNVFLFINLPEQTKNCTYSWCSLAKLCSPAFPSWGELVVSSPSICGPWLLLPAQVASSTLAAICA